MTKIYLVSGIALGEESKGAMTEFLTTITGSTIGVRCGGSQAAHHIVTPEREVFTFQQISTAFMQGATSVISPYMPCDPVALYLEAEELEKSGFDPFNLLHIHQNSIIITPIHRAISRLKELFSDNPKGSVGTGAGTAIRDSLSDSSITIRAGDLQNKELVLQKLHKLQSRKLEVAFSLIKKSGIETLTPDMQKEMRWLDVHDYLEGHAQTLAVVPNLFHIIDDQDFLKILHDQKAVVVESSHGTLLHPWYGFVPHVTQVDPTGQDLIDHLDKLEFEGEIIRLGALRCIMTRTGHGPIVTRDIYMTQKYDNDHNNDGHKWRGPFSNGPFDLLAIRYSIECIGGPEVLSGLMMSHFDVLHDYVGRYKKWPVCIGYEYEGDLGDLDTYFHMEGGVIKGIRVHPDTRDENHLKHQEELTRRLFDCKPIYTLIEGDTPLEVEEKFIHFVEENLGLPVVITAHGPSINDRQVIPEHEHLFEESNQND